MPAGNVAAKPIAYTVGALACMFVMAQAAADALVVVKVGALVLAVA